MNQKPLLSSLKEKKRYVVFQVISKNNTEFDRIKSEIIKNIKDFVGQMGLEKMGLMFLDDWKNQKGILKVNNRFVDTLKASFVFMNNKEFMVRSLLTSGTLKKIRGIM